MQLILDKKRPGKKHKTPLQARFDKLNEKVQKQRRLNERFRRDLDKLAETYRNQFHEHNSKLLDTLVALTEKLCTFASRKTLSDWHREELMDWVHELVVMRIGPVDPETSQRLLERFENSLASLMGLSREEMVERMRVEEEELKRIFNEPFDDEDYIDPEALFQDDLFGFDDIPPGPDAPEQDDNNPFGSDWTEQQPGQSITDSAWLKSLFRRAAQALHPDREADPEQRQHKQKRMSELLKARKHDDVMTMLAIYSETLGEHDIQVAEEEMQAICELLEDQLDDLEYEQVAYAQSHPERQLVYDLFYHPTAKKREAALNMWKEDLKVDAALSRRLVRDLRNLTQLKAELGERREARLGFDWEFDDIPW